MSEIILKDICKSWGETQALSNVNFSCENGKLLVLLGPSGCGKSTILRIISGLETPSSGRVEIAGRDVTHLPPVKRDITMVFQNYALFPHLTVAENILFGLKARRMNKTEQQARLKDAAKLLGLSDLLERKPAQLSGGQRQRVALGRSIVAQVSVCLMDEPLSNLDAKLRQEMRQEIRSLQQRLKMTMVYVTHDQVEAMTLADKIILIKNGIVEQHGTPEELYNKPATTFTASFIGNPPMNILKPEGAIGQHLTEAFNSSVSDYLLGIRPENIEISDSKGIPAEVESIEYLGADSLLACKTSNQKLIVTTKGKSSLSWGERINLNWHKKDIHFFNPSSASRAKTPWEKSGKAAV